MILFILLFSSVEGKDPTSTSEKRQYIMLGNIYINDLLSPSFKSEDASPHCIIELPIFLYNRTRENIIMVNGIYGNSKGVIQYEKIEYGANIRCQDVAGVKEIDLSRTKHRYVLITTTREECLSYFKNRMFTIDCNLQLNSENKGI